MATIYRFIVEQKQKTTRESGRKDSSVNGSSKGAGKKGRWVSILNSDKGGVEHNRKMRAINPLLNKITGGAWEKGMRLGRAGAGLVQKNTETGKFRISGTAVTIIFAFLMQQLIGWWKRERDNANKLNAQNFKALENGVGAVRSEYEISAVRFTGRLTYNQNK